jgi:hypothetical protein
MVNVRKNTVGYLFFLSFALCGHALSQSASVAEISVGAIRVYKTTRQSEKHSVLHLPKRIQTPQGPGLQEQYQVIFSIAVAGVAEGDVIHVSAEMEATNDCGYDIAFGTWLMIGNDPARTVPDSSKGESYLSFPSGYNITNGNYMLPGAGDRGFMHHGSVTRSGVYVVPKGISGTRHINFIGYAQVDKLDCKKGGGLKVEKGNGQMSVLHFIAKR